MGDHSDIDHTGITGVGGALTVEDEGTPLATGATTLDFVGAGVTASGTGAEKTITIPGGSGIIAYDFNVYTGGDITFSSTTPAAVTGPTDLTVAASTGDVVDLGISAIINNTTAASLGFDFATIVSASPVNYLSSGNGTPITVGVMGWFVPINQSHPVTGSYKYVVQAGDISGGNVVFRLYARVSSGSRVISASSTTPLWTQATNFGQP